MYGSIISFEFYDVFFLKIPTVKNSPGGFTPPPNGPSIASMYANIIYDLTIAIISK